MLVIAIIKAGKYYRTAILREVRKLLGIDENDEIEWIFEDSKVIMRKKDGKNG